MTRLILSSGILLAEVLAHAVSGGWTSGSDSSFGLVTISAVLSALPLASSIGERLVAGSGTAATDLKS
jgi:hypothetical protein